MYTQKDFEKFESVLAYCKKRLPEPSLPSLPSEQSLDTAMQYGQKMDFFDSRNKLSQSGELLAGLLLSTDA
ncbi:hypothetical protein N8857_05035 [Planktomarina temperata]|nr:hypothetical protein [Planktomarina temperata]